MHYLITARVKPGREKALLQAIEDESIGAGSVAGDEYLRNMSDARVCVNGAVKWVEVCFCNFPLEEERPYWEQFFELSRVQDAHGRHRCRDLDASGPWACSDCDCTARLEGRLATQGMPFMQALRAVVQDGLDVLSK